MRILLLLFLILAFAKVITAQTINTGKITAILKNEKQQALENATVQLIKSKDSSLVKVAITDNQGVAEFEHVIPGSYLLKATMVNHATRYSALINISPNEPVIQVPVLLNSQ